MEFDKLKELVKQEALNSMGSNLQSVVDLHGLSVEKARASVNRHLNLVEQTKISKFRFVTGRGNHINSRGERGTLFQEFPSWLSDEALSKITSLKKFEGYYEIDIKTKADKKPLGQLLERFSHQWLKDHMDEIKASAQKGNPEDQYILGECYQYGTAVDQNYTEAVHWYQKSAKQDNSYAQFALGGCYWQGKGVRQNDQQAIDLFEKAAAKDLPSALHHLGDMYRYGEGVKQNLVLAKSYYQKASDLGLDIAKRKLAHLYFFGHGLPKDEKIACSLYKEIADKGDAHAAYNLGCAYLHGKGVEKKPKLAFQYVKQAADQNDPDAQYLIYRFYNQGIGTDNNPVMGYAYLERSAQNNFKQAVFELALHPNTKNQGRTIEYLIKAAKLDHIFAQVIVLKILPEQALPAGEYASIVKSFLERTEEEILAIPNDKLKFKVIDAYLAIENLTKKQKHKLLSLLTTLADQQHPQAFLRLGAIYHAGLLGGQDLEKAEQYWQRGAKLGDPDCLCSLGYYYEEKAQVDFLAYEIACAYHAQAAKLGSANSYNQLGLLYQEGKGIEKNITLAVQCFNQAMYLDNSERIKEEDDGINNGSVYPYAACNLARLYAKGEKDFPKDDKMALFWFTIAAAAGHEGAQQVIERMGIPEPEKLYQKISKISFWKTPSKPSEEKKEPKVILTELTEALNLTVDWKITKSDQAWGYIDASQLSRLESYSIEPFTLRKTKDQQLILLLEKLSSYDLSEIADRIKTQVKSTKFLQY